MEESAPDFEPSDLPSGRLPAGLFDPQVNGYAGVDFQSDDLQVAELRRATEAWCRDGGSGFYLTLVTDEWRSLMTRLRRVAGWVRDDPELQRVIRGWHVEGPFLSPQPGYHGAHDPARMRDPSPELLDELREAVGDGRVVLTLAPERRGSMATIARARELGIRVSLGHTDASAECLREAVAAGATAFTHLGNGCPQQLDRHDNILWRVAEVGGLLVGLIADGIHVSGSLFRLLHRVIPAHEIYYTTDAMSAAGGPPGVYRLGRLTVEVGADGVVRQPGRQNFAGSSLTPKRLRASVAAMLGDVTEAERRMAQAAVNLARVL